MRIASGVPGFDALVEGGFPRDSSVIVQGPAGREKDAFLFQFIVQGLRRGGAALVVLSSISPAKYQQELRDAGIDVDRAIAENRLKFVDWFTYKENPVHDVEEDGPVFRASIDLANVGIALSRAIASLPRGGEKRAALEILSPALGMYDVPAVYGFAQSTKAKLERFGFTSVVALEKEMHDERTVSSIHQPFDGVVDFERVREGDEIVRKVAVLSLVGTNPGSKYVPLEFGPDRVLRVSTAPIQGRTILHQQELLKLNPRDPKLWLATARNLGAMGEDARALKCVEASLNLDPSDEEAWRYKSELLEALGRKGEAEQARARGGAPAAPPRKGDGPARIMDLLEERLQTNARDPDALFGLAVVLADANDLLGAVSVLEKLGEVDGKYPGLWMLKAKLHTRLGEIKKAEEAQAREPVQAPSATIAEDPSTRLLRLAEQRLLNNPYDPDALFATATVLARADDLLGAVALLDKLAEVDETYPGLWVLKTQLHARRGELEKAQESRTRRLEIEARAERPDAQPSPHTPSERANSFCPSCGSAVGDEDAICGSCGVLFEGPEEQSPAHQPEPKVAAESSFPRKSEPEALPPRPSKQKRPRGEKELRSSLESELRSSPRSDQSRKGRTNGLVKDATRERGRTNGLVNGVRGRTNGLVKDATRERGRTNGLVNGVRGRTNGLVNGTRGRTNGLTNGMRGRTNGLVNGVRGRTNGLVNGTRGWTNGLTNGMRGRTNGLVNGVGSQQLGVTNGLTNGMGLTNGLGSSRIAREHRLAKWKLYLVPLVAIALLLTPILGPEGPVPGIAVDGNTSDWDPARISPQDRSTGINPNVDIVRVASVADAQTLSFLIDVAGEMLVGGGSPATTDRFDVFIDTDRDPATGYPVDSLGADRLIDVWGHGGGVDAASLYAWTGGPGSQDWRKWEPAGSAAAAAAGSHLELQTSWSAIASERTPVTAAVHARGYEASVDASDGVLNSEGGSLQVLQEPVVADVIPMATATTLLRLEITAMGREAALSGLGVTLTGLASPTSVTSVRLVDGSSNVVDQRTPVDPRISFQFPARTISLSSPQQFFVIADVLPFGGQTLGAVVADASDVLANVPVSVRRAPSPRDVGYLSFVPPEPRVDGGFGEWMASLPDPQGDAGRQDVDITSFDARFSGNTSFLYAAVDGRILSGTWVPQGNRAVPVPAPRVDDADRDTVPDAVDPYPYDFNNDLVDDALSGGDVDADGLLDYGQGGPDWWLNTTIPASFPAPYGNRTVNAFIGPWESPFQTRDDVLRVFVDLDNSTGTGYSLAGLGADRLVEISGTEGRVRTADFFTFGGSYPGQWSWVPLSPATVATGFGQLELSVAENLSAVPGARYFVEAEAPLGEHDDVAGTRGAGKWSAPIRSPGGRANSFASGGPQLLDIGGNQKLYLRDTTHGTETACTTNKVASSTQGAGASKASTLSAGESACWYADSTTGTTISAGDWETLLDVDTSVPKSAFKDGSSASVPTGSIALIDSMSTVLPAKDNLVVAAIQFDNTNAATRSITAGNLELRRGTTTMLAENQFAIDFPASGGAGDGMFAVLVYRDTSGTVDPTYGVYGLASGSGVNAEVKFLVLNGLASGDSAFLDGSSTTVTGAADSLGSLSTSFPTSSSSLPNIIVAAVQTEFASAGEFTVSAGSLVLRRGTSSSDTAIVSNQYAFGLDDPPANDGISAVLVAEDESGALNQAYSVWATVSPNTARMEAKILAFRGLSANAVDGAHNDDIDTSRVVLGTATTSFAAGDDIVIGAIQIDAQTSTRTIAAAGDDIRRNGEGSGSSNEFAHTIAHAASSWSDGQWQTFVRKVTTTSSSPSYEGGATGPATNSIDAEVKLVAIHVNDSAADYDVHLEIWNLDTNTIAETIKSCTDVATRGEDVRCFITGVGQKTISSTQVVRIRLVHSSSSGKVTFDYDDSDATGDSRATIPPTAIPEFGDLVLPVVATILMPLALRAPRRRRSKRMAG